MDPLLYVREEYDNVARALDESLRYDYGPEQTGGYYKECRYRLDALKSAIDKLDTGEPRPEVSTEVRQLWDLANRITLIERSKLGEFSWPFADAVRSIARSLLLEGGLRDERQPIIHILAQGTSYQISSEKVMGPGKKRRLYTVAFPRQLKHHVLMHTLFGHELGHAAFYSSRPMSAGDSLKDAIVKILRREGPLRDAASTMAWLRSAGAPETVRDRHSGSGKSITESNLQHWLVEIVCDLFGLTIYGPSFVAAHRTYLEPSCRSEHDYKIESNSHPAYSLRRNVLVAALRTQKWLDPVIHDDQSSVRKAEFALIKYISEPDYAPWACAFTDDQIEEAMMTIRSYFNSTNTPVAIRPSEDNLAFLFDRLERRLPPIREELDENGVSTTHPIRLEEQLYTGWTYWCGREAAGNDAMTFHQLNQLCDLGLLQQQAIDLKAGTRKL